MSCGCLCDNWKPSLLPYLAGVYFRAELHHVGHVGEQKSIVDQSKLEKWLVSDCKTNYMSCAYFLQCLVFPAWREKINIF